MFKTIVFLSLILYSSLNYGQEYFNIKNPGNDYYSKCQECLSALNQRPSEVEFGIYRDDNDMLYFYITQKEWFNKLFQNKSDGIAIDIVSKNRYDCSNKDFKAKATLRGKLLAPFYLKDLKSNIIQSDRNDLWIRLVNIPEEFRGKELEFNIIFLSKKYLCYYNSFIDIPSARWELMDMGFYMDSLTYPSRKDTSLTSQEKFLLQHKKLSFEIPFEKNKTEYAHEDIKPIYDSLRLTDFNIKSIKINSYSSVEGDTEYNITLQNKRSQSIAIAIQQIVNQKIPIKIMSSENWVEFLNDISGSDYSYLAKLSKENVKKKLENKSLSKALEPYLCKHRKAIVIL